jgi:hypothetical protein
MRPRFQADDDFNQKIVVGLRRRERAVVFGDAHAAGIIGVPDPGVLRKAAKPQRVVAILRGRGGRVQGRQAD